MQIKNTTCISDYMQLQSLIIGDGSILIFCRMLHSNTLHLKSGVSEFLRVKIFPPHVHGPLFASHQRIRTVTVCKKSIKVSTKHTR